MAFADDVVWTSEPGRPASCSGRAFTLASAAMAGTSLRRGAPGGRLRQGGAAGRAGMRGGLPGQASFLGCGPTSQTSPHARPFVRERLLCEPLTSRQRR